MCSVAQFQQKRWEGRAWEGSVSPVRSWKKPSSTWPTAASGTPISALFIGGDLARPFGAMGPLGGSALVDLRVRRGEVLGDDLDREDADDAAIVVDHRRVH